MVLLWQSGHDSDPFGKYRTPLIGGSPWRGRIHVVKVMSTTCLETWLGTRDHAESMSVCCRRGRRICLATMKMSRQTLRGSRLLKQNMFPSLECLVYNLILAFSLGLGDRSKLLNPELRYASVRPIISTQLPHRRDVLNPSVMYINKLGSYTLATPGLTRREILHKWKPCLVYCVLENIASLSWFHPSSIHTTNRL